MASIFGHGLVAYAVSQGITKPLYSKKLWLLGILCAILPDANVIAFKFGIPYESVWGHRGITHSLAFALLMGLLICIFIYRKSPISRSGVTLTLYFFTCTASHGLLDAMTTGGLGVAFFAPFDTDRYFLPWRLIQVSPIGVIRFFSTWGLKVILSELIWIGVPSLLLILFFELKKKLFKTI